MANLPTSEELAKLPLRSIIAYALRSSRRGSKLLHGLIEDNLIEAPLKLAENFVSHRNLDQSDAPAAALSVSAISFAMNILTTRKQMLAANSLTRTAMTVVAGFEAWASSANSKRAKHQIIYAARQAAKCAGAVAESLGDESPSMAAICAAQADYETLVERFGKDMGVVLGEPIDLVALGWKNAD